MKPADEEIRRLSERLRADLRALRGEPAGPVPRIEPSVLIALGLGGAAAVLLYLMLPPLRRERILGWTLLSARAVQILSAALH